MREGAVTALNTRPAVGLAAAMVHVRLSVECPATDLRIYFLCLASAEIVAETNLALAVIVS